MDTKTAFPGIDVKGKVVLAIRYEPIDDAGKSKFADKGYSDHATFTAKAKNAADHGAVALLIVNPANGEDRLMSLNSSAPASGPSRAIKRLSARRRHPPGAATWRGWGRSSKSDMETPSHRADHAEETGPCRHCQSPVPRSDHHWPLVTPSLSGSGARGDRGITSA